MQLSMRFITLFICFFSFRAFAQVPDIDCENWRDWATGQSTMNICSYKEYLEADAALNDAWALVKPDIDSLAEPNSIAGQGLPDAPTALLEAQRAWLKYRDNHCLTWRSFWDGGTGAPLIINTCLTELTERRTEELLELLRRPS